MLLGNSLDDSSFFFMFHIYPTYQYLSWDEHATPDRCSRMKIFCILASTSIFRNIMRLRLAFLVAMGAFGSARAFGILNSRELLSWGEYTSIENEFERKVIILIILTILVRGSDRICTKLCLPEKGSSKTQAPEYAPLTHPHVNIMPPTTSFGDCAEILRTTRAHQYTAEDLKIIPTTVCGEPITGADNTGDEATVTDPDQRNCSEVLLYLSRSRDFPTASIIITSKEFFKANYASKNYIKELVTLNLASGDRLEEYQLHAIIFAETECVLPGRKETKNEAQWHWARRVSSPQAPATVEIRIPRKHHTLSAFAVNHPEKARRKRARESFMSIIRVCDERTTFVLEQLVIEIRDSMVFMKGTETEVVNEVLLFGKISPAAVFILEKS